MLIQEILAMLWFCAVCLTLTALVVLGGRPRQPRARRRCRWSEVDYRMTQPRRRKP